MDNPDTDHTRYTIDRTKIRENRSIRFRKCSDSVVFLIFQQSENLSDLSNEDRNKRHSSPFINVVKCVFFVVRATLVPIAYLSAPSAVHSYMVPGTFIRRLKSLFV
jgi:hypothetical protein